MAAGFMENAAQAERRIARYWKIDRAAVSVRTMRHLRFTILLLALQLLLLTIAVMSLTDRAPLAEVAVSIAFIILLVVGGIAVAESRRSRFLMIVPASDFARLLVVAEALTGQMYVAILVAKLVAQFISAEIGPDHVD